VIGGFASANFLHVLAAGAAALLAGGINSVAGGGTLVSFSTLIWLGLPSITANATSTVAIWPGSLGSIWGFRRELRQTDPRLRLLSISSLIGGGLGALLLRSTPPGVFQHLVPFLMLFATLLFTLDGPIRKKLQERSGRAISGGIWMPGAFGLNLCIAIYGGYFGAGMSIIMLTSLSLLGAKDILRMAALTSLFSLCVNGVASVLFISTGMVNWHYVLPMAVAAVFGGYGAAGVARRIGRVAVRRFVIAVGFAMSLILFIRYL
jgi:uncharacterized membrane protein YfcA